MFDSNDWKIKKGHHKASRPHFGVYPGNRVVNYTVNFGHDCWHEAKRIPFSGINKLCGFTVGFGVHKNSIRVGWQPDKSGKINMFAYYYNKGIRESKKITSVDTGKDVQIELNLSNSTFSLTVAGIGYRFAFDYPRIKWGFNCFPYFGGKSVAPHNMNLKLIKH